MKNIILFSICLMLSHQSYGQAPIHGYLCFVNGWSSSAFLPNRTTACETACTNACSSCQASGDIWTWGGAQSGGEGCFDSNGLLRGYTSAREEYRCLVEDGYEHALVGSNGQRYCPSIDDEAPKDAGCTLESGAGNPCNVATGNKFQVETDFSNAALSFRRSYNSLNLVNLGLGAGWRHNFQRKLSVDGGTLIQIAGNGRGEPWSKIAGVWQGDADSDIAIVETSTGFELTRANNVVESYNNFGQLLSITDTNGQATSYTYNASNQLDKVTNHYGSSVSFTYDEFSLSSVTDALGSEYRFEYYANGNLQSVIYPDTTPGNESDNPRRTYHYENVEFPKHLTGITDENGNRYATWGYDSDGKANLSKHAETSTENVGQETFKLEHNYQEGGE